ncbi:MAG: hypothetical protein IIB11_03840 [Chloroflexi bacterium]|nr:hypothetical protein [Chloroflexota bacterium]
MARMLLMGIAVFAIALTVMQGLPVDATIGPEITVSSSDSQGDICTVTSSDLSIVDDGIFDTTDGVLATITCTVGGNYLVRASVVTDDRELRSSTQTYFADNTPEMVIMYLSPSVSVGSVESYSVTILAA